MNSAHCARIRGYYDWLLDNKQPFIVQQKMFKNALTQRVIEIYMEENHATVVDISTRLVKILPSMPKRFAWLAPLAAPAQGQVAAVHKLIKDPRLYSKLIALFEYLLENEC